MTAIKFEGGPIDGDAWSMDISGDLVSVPVAEQAGVQLESDAPITGTMSVFHYRLYRYGSDQALALPQYAQELVKVGAALDVDRYYLASGGDAAKEAIASKLQKQMQHHAEMRLLEVIPSTITIESGAGREQFQDRIVVWAWTRPWTWAK